mmetsp:Transcript_46043/g.73721  ORF Transcript_46043/g.73721 Transcript_46043/m.73721 type:complete len:228 (-) Transcript_46043:5-688(-)
MGGEVLGDGEALEAVHSEERLELIVRDDPSLVLRIHELVGLEVGPHLGRERGARDLLLPNERRKLRTALVGLLQATCRLPRSFLLAQGFETVGVEGHVRRHLLLVPQLVRFGQRVELRACRRVHGFPPLSQSLGDLREFELRLRRVDLGARHLDEAHVSPLGALGFVGVHHVLALATPLLLDALGNLLHFDLLARFGHWGGGDSEGTAGAIFSTFGVDSLAFADQLL